MPLYSLTCGNCQTVNNVSAEDEPISWVCNNCGNENMTSLPITAGAQLITDAAKATAILSPQQAAQAINIVTGEVIS